MCTGVTTVPSEAGQSGLGVASWPRLIELSPQRYEEKELLRLVYFGGVQREIRRAVWPFLLGHYQFRMSEAERKEVNVQLMLQLLNLVPQRVELVGILCNIVCSTKNCLSQCMQSKKKVLRHQWSKLLFII